MEAARKRAILLGLLGVLVAGSLAYALQQWSAANRFGWTGATFQSSVSPGGLTTFVVERVRPRSPASRAGLRPGDRVLEVDGKVETDLDAIRRHKAGETLSLLIQHPDKTKFTAALRLEDPRRRATVVLGAALNGVTGFLFLALGCFVYWRRPADSRALILFVACAAFGLARLLAAGPTRGFPMLRGTSLLPASLTIAASFCFFPALLHFCLVFPRRRPLLERYPAALRWIYGVPAVNAALLILFLVITVTSRSAVGETIIKAAGSEARHWVQVAARYDTPLLGGLFLALLAAAAALSLRWRAEVATWGWKDAFLSHPRTAVLSAVVLPSLLAVALRLPASIWRMGPSYLEAATTVPLVVLAAEVGAGFFAQWVVFPIAACVALYRTYREAGVEERNQVRWPLWGVVTGVAGFLLADPIVEFARFLLDLDRESAAYAVLFFLREHLDTLCLLLIPLSFAFAILKYRLMEITVYIRRTVVYGSVTGLLGLLYLLLIGGLGGLLSRYSGARSQWAPIVSTLLVLVVFVPVRNRVQRIVDRRFFRRRHDYAAALQALARGIAQTSEERRLFDLAVNHLEEALQNRSVLVFARPPGGYAFAPVAKVGLRDNVLEQFSIPATGPLAAQLAAIRPPRFEELPEAEARALETAGCVLLVPIRRRDELMGFLSLGSKLSGEEYDQEDYEFLSAAAAQITVGIDNIRLAEQQREFERAREIQEALLPQRIPQAPGIGISGAWQPARAVGGDYYDVLELSGGRLALVIADVAGKGLTAALLMSNLQAAVKAYASEMPAPRELSSRVNKMISGNIGPNRFITFFYGLLDTTARTLSYVNAGHCPPILYRASGEVVRLERGGIVLGVIADAEFEEGTVQLRDGDRLLLYTDGLSEAFRPDGEEEFGDERLIALLRAGGHLDADQLKTSILAAVSAFCAGNFQDDATLIAVTVRPGIRA